LAYFSANGARQLDRLEHGGSLDPLVRIVCQIAEHQHRAGDQSDQSRFQQDGDHDRAPDARFRGGVQVAGDRQSDDIAICGLLRYGHSTAPEILAYSLRAAVPVSETVRLPRRSNSPSLERSELCDYLLR
jgi:hypothetical protein